MGFLSPEKLIEGKIDTLFGSVFNDFTCEDGEKRLNKMNKDKEISNKPVFCGMDEAGRGPWAGPVVACALVFKKKDIRIPGLKDSKKLSAEKREEMYQKIARLAYFGIGRAEALEIDSVGLIAATKNAYERALIQLITNMEKETAITAGSLKPIKQESRRPQIRDRSRLRPNNDSAQKNYPLFLLIDGRDKFNLPYPATSIIKGDEKVKIIACASIMAKVERDRIMMEMAGLHPGYGFEMHKGYGTAAHQRALKKFGLCGEHRKSYKPVAKMLK